MSKPSGRFSFMNRFFGPGSKKKSVFEPEVIEKSWSSEEIEGRKKIVLREISSREDNEKVRFDRYIDSLMRMEFADLERYHESLKKKVDRSDWYDFGVTQKAFLGFNLPRNSFFRKLADGTIISLRKDYLADHYYIDRDRILATLYTLQSNRLNSQSYHDVIDVCKVHELIAITLAVTNKKCPKIKEVKNLEAVLYAALSDKDSFFSAGLYRAAVDLMQKCIDKVGGVTLQRDNQPEYLLLKGARKIVMAVNIDFSSSKNHLSHYKFLNDDKFRDEAGIRKLAEKSFQVHALEDIRYMNGELDKVHGDQKVRGSISRGGGMKLLSDLTERVPEVEKWASLFEKPSTVIQKVIMQSENLTLRTKIDDYLKKPKVAKTIANRLFEIADNMVDGEAHEFRRSNPLGLFLSSLFEESSADINLFRKDMIEDLMIGYIDNVLMKKSEEEDLMPNPEEFKMYIDQRYQNRKYAIEGKESKTKRRSEIPKEVIPSASPSKPKSSLLNPESEKVFAQSIT